MTGYHYSNLDGSYYYNNPDGTTYYNDGRGGSRYTKADGSGWDKQQFPAPSVSGPDGSSANQEQGCKSIEAASEMVVCNPSHTNNAGAMVGRDIEGAMIDADDFVMVPYNEVSASSGGTVGIKTEDAKKEDTDGEI